MAIQLDLKTTQHGIPFAGAYFRISMAAISRRRDQHPKFWTMINVSGYATSTPTPDTYELDFRSYNVPMAEVEEQVGATFLDKCYAWVMKQPDMVNAKAV